MDVTRLQSDKILSDIVALRHSTLNDSAAGRAACRDPEVCANCGAQFDCRPGNCWCDRVYVPREALEEMRQTFDRCLCPNCLKAVSGKHD